MTAKKLDPTGTTGGGEKETTERVRMETMPEAITQMKVMLETLVKKVGEHDKQMETLATANRAQAGGSGLGRVRRNFRPIPFEFTTPQRSQTRMPPPRPTAATDEQDPEVHEDDVRTEADPEPVINLDEDHPA
ncbi:unnamed protein product [Arabis nemorensis]|uniref:Uncharacterized protein n=1 Tax=Arabis nemorensis TaxID=586526 RepID=A0A565BSK7_9BRAS|nr:unnamed protein product [Arabis nemorensis]